MTRAAISGLTGGRPRVARPESLVQCARNRRRCHRRMVSGVTITRGCRHPAQAPASATQKSRSGAELRPGHRSLVDGELLVQGEVFEGELAVVAAKKGQEAKQLEPEGDHRTRIFAGSEPADQPLPAGLNFGEGQAADGHGQDARPAGDLLLGESGLLHRNPPVPVEDRRSRHVLKSEMVQFHGGRSNEFETGVLTRQ